MFSVEAVDIIIPIYNAYEELKKCLRSVEACTDLTKHRLILIDDASTDMRVVALLKALEKRYTVLYSEYNCGFANTVNKGIEYSERDVVLLHSDTQVTESWLEKMQHCAFHDVSTGTVTPYTNYGEQVSITQFLRMKQDLPEVSVERYARIVAWCGRKQYPRIPSGDAFCLYIKRKLLNTIGHFREVLSLKGYGSERDFCYRAAQFGCGHVLCDDVFIYHEGNQSFCIEEQEEVRTAMRGFLKKEYPQLYTEEEAFWKELPIQAYSEQILFFLKLDNKKKTILYLLQSDFREGAEDCLGGTQLHVKDLTMELKELYNIVVVARDSRDLNVIWYDGETMTPCRYYLKEESIYPDLRDGKLAKLYGDILDVYRVDLVHIHHAKGLSLEMYYQAAKRAIPIVSSIHDYYYVCPMVILWREGNTFCGPDQCDECAACLYKEKGISKGGDYIHWWRMQNQQALSLANVCITPSYSTKNIMISYFSELNGKVRVIEHGVTLPVQDMQPGKQRKEKEFHVAFVGGIGKAKGSEEICQLVKSNAEGIFWYLLGYPGDTEIARLKGRNYKCTGRYKREKLGELFRKYEINLVCILSCCPETFNYTMSEAIALKTPVLVRDTGALGERVRTMKCGWVVPREATADEILKQIQYVKEHPENYEEIIHNLRMRTGRDAKQMSMDYAELYEEFLADVEKKTYSDDVNPGYIANGYLRMNGMVLGENREEGQELMEFYHLQQQIKEIENSTVYKIAKKIGKIPFPYKDKMGLGIQNLYRLIRYGKIY